MANVNQPTVTLDAAGVVDYSVTPHHPTLVIAASGVVDYSVTPHHPTLTITATGSVGPATTTALTAFEGTAEVATTVSGNISITPTRVTPPAGYDTPVRTTTFQGGLEITLDRFGRLT